MRLEEWVDVRNGLSQFAFCRTHLPVHWEGKMEEDTEEVEEGQIAPTEATAAAAAAAARQIWRPTYLFMVAVVVACSPIQCLLNVEAAMDRRASDLLVPCVEPDRSRNRWHCSPLHASDTMQQMTAASDSISAWTKLAILLAASGLPST